MTTRHREARRSAAAIDYGTLADLRYQLRQFERTREVAVRAAGIAPQQYLLLLQVKGLEGRRPATIGTLAERLQLAHHSTVELVDRLVRKGMLARLRGGRDRRLVTVVLRPAARRMLQRLASYSLAELQSDGPALVAALRRLISVGGGSRQTSDRSMRGTTLRGPYDSDGDYGVRRGSSGAGPARAH